MRFKRRTHRGDANAGKRAFIASTYLLSSSGLGVGCVWRIVWRIVTKSGSGEYQSEYCGGAEYCQLPIVRHNGTEFEEEALGGA